MLPTGFRTFHFVSILYVFFLFFSFLLFRFFSHYFVFVFLRFVSLRFFSLLFCLFSFRFFSFRFFSFLFVFSVSQFTGTPDILDPMRRQNVRNLRNDFDFNVPNYRLQSTLNSYFPSTIRLWDNLEPELKLHSHQTPDQPPLIPDQFLWLGRV